MKVGTKSLLFGVHQIFLHPIFVALAWYKLYGMTWDPRIWTAFIVHDWGYWGCPEIDGAQGDKHPLLGADIMHRLFDIPDIKCECRQGNTHYSYEKITDSTWYYFALYHSRFLAKQDEQQPSRLCFADKLATHFYPTWLFVFLATLSGEMSFFMNEASQKKHATMDLDYSTPWTFVNSMKAILYKYAFDHKDGQHDTLT